jgi:hypothetical protein
MKVEAGLGLLCLATSLAMFGPAFAYPEGIPMETVASMRVGTVVTLIGGSVLLYISQFNTDEDPAFAV